MIIVVILQFSNMSFDVMFFCTLLRAVFKTLYYYSFIDVVEAQIAVVDIGIKIFLVSLNAFLMIRFFFVSLESVFFLYSEQCI